MAASPVQPSLRVARAGWVFLTGAVVVGLVGLIAHASRTALLASAVAPTAYVLVVDPQSNRTRISRVLAAHAVGLASGTLVPAVLGLGGTQLNVTSQPTLREVASAALAIGLCNALLDVLRLHHAPAISTALLVGATLVPIGRAEVELAIGLVVAIFVAWLLRAVGRRVLPDPEPA